MGVVTAPEVVYTGGEPELSGLVSSVVLITKQREIGHLEQGVVLAFPLGIKGSTIFASWLARIQSSVCLSKFCKELQVCALVRGIS